jgi:hypothetical protein
MNSSMNLNMQNKMKLKMRWTWTRRFQRSLLLPMALLGSALLASSSSHAITTTFDFVSSGGQFSIASNTLSFGNGLTISAASTGGNPDSMLAGATILLDSIELTGTVESLAAGVARVGIAPGQTLSLQIFEPAGDGGDLLATATYDPGDFIVIGASGILSGPVAPGLTDLVVTPLGESSSTVLSALLASGMPIDFNATLSAAGQNIAQRIASGALVTGSVAGSVAVIPEPSTAMLMGLGLGGLGLGARRARARNSR